MKEAEAKQHLALCCKIIREEDDGVSLQSEIEAVVEKRLLVLAPSVTLRGALLRFGQSGLDYALVQESPDTILGVVSREDVECRSELVAQLDTLTIGKVMNRNVSIEPISASILEVMERLTHGPSASVVIVRQDGRPVSVLGAKNLISILSQLAPIRPSLLSLADGSLTDGPLVDGMQRRVSRM